MRVKMTFVLFTLAFPKCSILTRNCRLSPTHLPNKDSRAGEWSSVQGVQEFWVQFWVNVCCWHRHGHVDVDNVYTMSTAVFSPWIFTAWSLQRQGTVKQSVMPMIAPHKSHCPGRKTQARQSLTFFLVLKPFDLNCKLVSLTDRQKYCWQLCYLE